MACQSAAVQDVACWCFFLGEQQSLQPGSIVWQYWQLPSDQWTQLRGAVSCRSDAQFCERSNPATSNSVGQYRDSAPLSHLERKWIDIMSLLGTNCYFWPHTWPSGLIAWRLSRGVAGLSKVNLPVLLESTTIPTPRCPVTSIVRRFQSAANTVLRDPSTRTLEVMDTSVAGSLTLVSLLLLVGTRDFLSPNPWVVE